MESARTMNLFYYILVYPIELFLEIIFSVIDRASSNPGIAIIGVSITISFLLLPLYKRADAIQTEGIENAEVISGEPQATVP